MHSVTQNVRSALCQKPQILRRKQRGGKEIRLAVFYLRQVEKETCEMKISFQQRSLYQFSVRTNEGKGTGKPDEAKMKPSARKNEFNLLMFLHESGNCELHT